MHHLLRVEGICPDKFPRSLDYGMSGARYLNARGRHFPWYATVLNALLSGEDSRLAAVPYTRGRTCRKTVSNNLATQTNMHRDALYQSKNKQPKHPGVPDENKLSG